MLAYGRQHPIHRFKGHSDDVNVIKLNRTKTLLASGGDDGDVRVWSLVGVAPGVASPDGTTTDGEVEDGEEMDEDDEKSRKKRLASRGGCVLMSHGGEVVSLAWSRKDPKLLAS